MSKRPRDIDFDIPFRKRVRSEFDRPSSRRGARVRKRRLRHSVWRFTGGPNIPLDSTDHIITAVELGLIPPQPEGSGDLEAARQALSDRLESALDIVFSKQKLSELVEFRDPEAAEWRPGIIEDVDLQFSVELGPKFKRVHAEGLIKITHRTKIHLSYDRVRQSLAEVLGVPSGRLHLKMLLIKKDLGLDLEQYLDKQQPDRFDVD